MEPLKHECGVAMIRLLRPLEYYKEKYGTYLYGLNLLYLMMEKQHNRGQEGAGVGVVKLNSIPGNEYVFRERALGANAIDEIFKNIGARINENDLDSPETVESLTPYIGEIYMGHLRYSTTGKSGISYVHPFLRRNNWKARNLLMCGNFNMTNVDEIFEQIVNQGQHPRIYSDTIVLLEQLGYSLDQENQRLYHMFKDKYRDPELGGMIDNNNDIKRVLEKPALNWDGGFVICGATGSGDMFALRDSHGIRPAFYYADDEIIALASERPVLQTALNKRRIEISELMPGQALIVSKNGKMAVEQVLPELQNERCSFERIYFSRGSDADIYQERKALGRNLVPVLYEKCGKDLSNVVLSFIPNTAEVAFIGMVEGFEKLLSRQKREEILKLQSEKMLNEETLNKVMDRQLRVEKVAIKDIKLRTFIAEGKSRNDLAAHVYDVTYGCIVNDVDTLIVIDDSIVRGTTLHESIIRILDRLHPKKIIVVSSAPQVRFPDYYGIDMSRLSEFISFKAAVSLIKKEGRDNLLKEVYDEVLSELNKPAREQRNVVKRIYEKFTDEQISKESALLLTPAGTSAEIELVYQTVEGLHNACPSSPGDWYFSGNYPTPGGIRRVNMAYKNFYEGNNMSR